MKKGSMLSFLVLWIVVIAVLSFFMKPIPGTSCKAQDGSLLVTARSGYSLTVVYDELTSAEYRELMDFGTMVDGVDDRREKSGIWHSDELGSYQLCVNPKVTPCLILRTADEVFVINFESKDATKALYDAIRKQTCL